MTERFDTLKFLEEYQRFPCLWKKKCADFKNRAKRDHAEEVLLPISGLSTVKELRQKIRSIRCTYNQEVRKIKKAMETGTGTYEGYYPKLAWFALADSFLRQNIEENDSESNLYTQDIAESEPFTSNPAESPSIPDHKFTKRRKLSVNASDKLLDCTAQDLHTHSRSNDNKKESEWNVFAHFIAQSIEKLSTKKMQLKCKHRIINVLMECEEEDVD